MNKYVTTLSSCLSCTTPPTAYVSGLTDGAVFSEIDTAYTLRISVQDNENDALTCKAYLDGAASPFSTMTVNGTSSVKEAAFPNTINMASLSEGTHTIRLEVKDAIAPVRSVSITFRVDKTAPVITGCVSEEAERQIALQIAATDAVAGIESYRFTFGGVTGTWSSSPETSFDELIPNTVYSYGVSVKDTAGHITSQTGTVATKAEKPLVGKKAAEMDSMEIQIKDGNAAGTEYVIHVGDFYADGNGMLSANPVPLVLTGDADGMKLFTVHGLNDNTEYAVLVCAKGKRGSADDIWSNIIQIKTKKAPVIRPAMANAVVSGSAVGQTKTVLSWEEIEGATGYDVEADGTVYAVGTSLSFEHAGLSEGSSHTYRVRGRNSYVKGAWSETMLLTTSPQTPAVPDGIFAVIQEDRLFVSWNGAEDVLSYDIEVNGTVYEDAGAMAYQQAITKEEAEAGFLIRVRGKNAGGISDWSAPVSVLPSEEPPVIPSLGEILLTKQERGSDYLLFLWKPAEGAFSYEVTLNGQTVQRGHQPMAYLGSLTPDVQYTVIIKALGAEGSTEKEIVLTTLGVNEEGSEPNQPLPDRSLSMVQEAIKNTHTGEKIKIVVPVTNLAPGRYQAVISFDKSEAVLYDACGVTSVRELGSCYLEHKKQQIIVEERDGRIYVTTIFETKKKVKEMTAAHVVLKSKGSSVTIHYEM